MFSCVFAIITANKTSFFIRFFSGIIAVHAGIFPLTVYIRNQCYLFHDSLLSYSVNLTIPRFLGSFMNSPIPPCNIFLASVFVYPRLLHQSEQKSPPVRIPCADFRINVVSSGMFFNFLFKIICYSDISRQIFYTFRIHIFSILPAHKGQDFKNPRPYRTSLHVILLSFQGIHPQK